MREVEVNFRCTTEELRELLVHAERQASAGGVKNLLRRRLFEKLARVCRQVFEELRGGGR